MRTLSVYMKQPQGAVEQYASGLSNGVWPEDLDVQANEHGVESFTFTLRRDPQVEWPELQPFTPVWVVIDGQVAAAGRIAETPARLGGGDDVFDVVCEGWQAHLQDDALQTWFVQASLDAWVDARTVNSTSLTLFTTSNRGTVDQGDAVNLSLFNGTAMTVDVNGNVGVMLDAGPRNLITNLAWTYTNTAMTATAITSCRCYGGSTDSFASATNQGDIIAAGAGAGGATSNMATTTGSATGYRYIFVVLRGQTGTLSADVSAKFTQLIAFTSSSYTSASASVLKASQVVSAVLPYAPFLSQATTDISATTFSIPSFAGPTATPRDYIEAANAYHLWQWKVQDGGAGEPSRLVYRAIPTTPTLVARVGKGITFDDASRNDGSDVYNRCLVEYTDPRGNDKTEERTTAGLTGGFATPPIVWDRPAEVVTTISGTFETDTIGATPTGWTAAAGTSVVQAAGGDPSGRCTRITTNGAGASLMQATFSGLTVGKRYRAECRINRLVGWTTGNAQVSVNIGNTTYTAGGISVASFVVGTYQTVSVEFIAILSTARVDIGNGSADLTTAVMDVDNVIIRHCVPTIVDRQGFMRTFVLSTGSAMDTSAAQQIGDTFLQAHRSTPLRGSLGVSGPALERTDGSPLPPHLIARHIGDGILITEQDPDTGSIGRLGVIAAASYTHATDTATVTIDTRRDFIDGILSRFSIYQS